MHQQTKSHKQDKEQTFQGTLADEVCKLAKQQEHRPNIQCVGIQIDNVYRFKYLGTVFSADAKQGAS